MGARIAFVFIAIILLGVGLYVHNSGGIGKSGNFFQSLVSTSSRYSAPGTPSYSYQAPSYPSGGTVVTPVPTPSPSPINPADIPAGFTASQLSPYFHQIRFGSISAGSAYYYGQISLYAYLPQGASTSVDVTGWQIKSNRGGEYIPQAVNLYDPSGLAPAGDIRLTTVDSLYLYSSSAPVNLRLNKCMGYLQNKTQFNPQLPQSCPYLDRSEIQSFSGACQNYIMSLGNCQSPDFSNPYFPRNDYICQDYLNNHFNYRACFDVYHADADFLSHEVRVWTGSSPVDQFHDRVSLLDSNGLLVDFSSY